MSAAAAARSARAACRSTAREVALLDVRDRRHLAVRTRQVLDDLAAHAAHRLAPAFRRGGAAGAADVVLGDPPARPLAGDRREIDAELLRDATDERRRLHAPAGGCGLRTAFGQPWRRPAGPRPVLRSRRAPSRPGRPRPRRRGSARTLPAAGDGISTVVLSVWISTSGASSAISSPSATSHRATSPSVRPSPRSGQLELVRHRRRKLPAGRARPRRPRGRSARAGPRRRARARPPARRRRARAPPRAARSRPAACDPRSRSRPRCGSCSFSGSGTSARRRPGSKRASPSASGRNETPATGITRIRGSSHRTRSPRRRVAEVVARAAPVALEPEPEPLGHRRRRRAARRARRLAPFTTCVTRRSTTTLASASASSPVERVLAAQQRRPSRRPHSRGDARGPRRSRSASQASFDPRDRPPERQVVAHVERHLRASIGHSIAVPHTSPSPCSGVTVAGREERAVDRDRQVQRRPGDELLAVDVPALRAAAGSSSARRADAAASRCTPRNGRRVTTCPVDARPCTPSSSQSIRCGGSVNVTPHGPGVTSSIWTTSVSPARAPRTSIGPASACPSSSGRARLDSSRRASSRRSASRSDTCRPGQS